MSTAIDYTTCGRDNEDTHAVGLLRRPLCVVCDNPIEAAILQQIIHLSNLEQGEWVQASAKYIGRPFDLSKRSTSNYLSDLEDKGYIESRQPNPGRAKHYRIEAISVLEDIHKAGIEMTHKALMGVEDTDREGAKTDSKGGSNSRSPHKKDLSNSKQNHTEISAVDNPQGDTEDAREYDPDATTPSSKQDELTPFICRQLNPWNLDPKEAQDIRQTLEAMGLGEADIRAYVSERASDFKHRNRPLSKAEVLRYITTREDLVSRGYIRPLEPVSGRPKPAKEVEHSTKEEKKQPKGEKHQGFKRACQTHFDSLTYDCYLQHLKVVSAEGNTLKLKGETPPKEVDLLEAAKEVWPNIESVDIV